MLGDGTSTTSGTTNVNADTHNQITNNIDVTAQTGDATVAGNTQGGNATTGDASAGINLLNISNSNFSLADWFGVLFINVFGSWNGSFGVDTEAGELPVQPEAPGVQPSGDNTTTHTQGVQAFRFQPTESGTFRLVSASISSENSSQEQTKDEVSPQVLGSTSNPTKTAPPTLQETTPISRFAIASFICIIFGVLLVAADRMWTLHQRRAAKQIA
jgi:hypothetical protein